MKIYLAGPLFTTAERDFNAALRDSLQGLGHEVWLPQDHEPREKTSSEIFAMDVKGLEWAEVVVANMDGADPDSGTCWECGYAYHREMTTILYRTDFRVAGDTQNAAFNLMLAESADAVLELPFARVETVAASISDALSRQILSCSPSCGRIGR